MTRWDLGVPYPFPRPPDWTLSLEVAEHVPPELTGGFVANVVAARCGTFLSWAPPGQVGSGHVNLRPAAAVAHLLRRQGLFRQDNLTRSMQRNAALPNLRRNVAVYTRQPLPEGCALGPIQDRASVTRRSTTRRRLAAWTRTGSEARSAPDLRG